MDELDFDHSDPQEIIDSAAAEHGVDPDQCITAFDKQSEFVMLLATEPPYYRLITSGRDRHGEVQDQELKIPICMMGDLKGLIQSAGMKQTIRNMHPEYANTDLMESG